MTDRTLTLAEYKALEQAGRITRPLTDQAIGDNSQAKARRALNAFASAQFADADLDLDTHPRLNHRQRSTRADVDHIHATTSTTVRRPGPERTAQCGTRSGYQAHCRNHERPCVPCRDANAESRRQQRQRKGTT